MTQHHPPWQPHLDDLVHRLARLQTRIPADHPPTTLGVFREIGDVELHQARINFELRSAIESLVLVVDQLHREVEDLQRRSTHEPR